MSAAELSETSRGHRRRRRRREHGRATGGERRRATRLRPGPPCTARRRRRNATGRLSLGSRRPSQPGSACRVLGLQACQLVGVLLDRVGETQQSERALLWRRPSPRLERPRRGAHRPVNVFAGRGWRTRDLRAGRGVDDRVHGSSSRAHELAVDEIAQLVCRDYQEVLSWFARSLVRTATGPAAVSAHSCRARQPTPPARSSRNDSQALGTCPPNFKAQLWRILQPRRATRPKRARARPAALATLSAAYDDRSGVSSLA
jgi:hypothetical protein